MIKKWRRWLWLAGIAASLESGSAALAQGTSAQPFRGLFGSKTAADRTAEQRSVVSNRTAEIQVELAWLSDQTTFPYFLEAHVKGGNLEVRGYVSNKAVHEQALNLARLNSPLAVLDAIKAHPALAIRPVRRAPEQLQKSVQTALLEAFPNHKLAVQCDANGTVQVTGIVPTLEQKLAVSQALRRLHGCANVLNLTEVTFASAGGAPATPSVANPIHTPMPGAMPAVTASAVAVSPTTAPPKAFVGNAFKTPVTQTPATSIIVTTKEPVEEPVKTIAEPKRSGLPQFPSTQLPASQASGATFPAAQVPGTAFPGPQHSGTQSSSTPLPATQVPGSAFPSTQSLSPQSPSATFPSTAFSSTPSAPPITTPPLVPARPAVVTTAKLATSAPAVKVTTVEAPMTLFHNGGPTPQVKPGEPYESRGVVFLSTEPPAGNRPTPAVSLPPPQASPMPVAAPKTAAAKPAVTASQLKKRIETTVPALRQVRVTFTSTAEVRIDCTMPPGGDSGAIASQVLGLRELDPYKVDLHLQLPGGN
jgi:hypothetical protein